MDYKVKGDQLRGVINEANRLKAENAKLRKELESVGTAAYLYGRDDLKAENAKLRELCEYLWDFAKTCGADHPFLRELGIEVEE